MTLKTFLCQVLGFTGLYVYIDLYKVCVSFPRNILAKHTWLPTPNMIPLLYVCAYMYECIWATMSMCIASVDLYTLA